MFQSGSPVLFFEQKQPPQVVNKNCDVHGTGHFVFETRFVEQLGCVFFFFGTLCLQSPQSVTQEVFCIPGIALFTPFAHSCANNAEHFYPLEVLSPECENPKVEKQQINMDILVNGKAKVFFLQFLFAWFFYRLWKLFFGAKLLGEK